MTIHEEGESRYTQYEQGGVTVGVCHTGGLTKEDKATIERFKQTAIKRKPKTKTIKTINYEDITRSN